jgi:hypothetical protein
MRFERSHIVQSARPPSDSRVCISGAARGSSTSDRTDLACGPTRLSPTDRVDRRTHGGEMARGSSDVLLGSPERGKRSVMREEKGRRCAALGCETVLSTYNRSATCFVHTSPTRRPPLEGS